MSTYSSFVVVSATQSHASSIPLSTPTTPVALPLETSPTHSAVASRRFLSPCRLLRWRRSQPRIGDEIAVGQPLADDAPKRLDEAPAVAVRIAPLVVAEHLLVNVPMQVERVHGNVGAAQPALQETPEILQSVGVDVAFDVALGLVDDAVDVAVAHRPIRAEHVGNHLAAGLDSLADDRGQMLRARGRDDLGVDLALSAVENPGHDSLGDIPLILASAAGQLRALVGVQVPGMRADERLVSLDSAGELHKAPDLQGQPQPVEHKPRGFLSNSQRPMDFVGADPVLVVDEHPERRKPLLQPERRILEDRTDLDGELLPGVLSMALPAPVGRQERHSVAPTGRAQDAPVRPALLDHEGQAGFRIREVEDGFLERLGGGYVLVHAR